MSQLNGLDGAYKFTLFSGAPGLAAAATGQLGSAFDNAPGAKSLSLFAVISGLDGVAANSANFIVQTTFDSGSHWADIASFAFSSGTSARVHNLLATAVSNLSLTSGILSANALVHGVFGEQFRVLYGNAGTYAAGTIVIIGLAKQ